MRKAGVVFALAFAAVLGVGFVLLRWEARPRPPAEKPQTPPLPEIGDITPDGYARFVAAYPPERGTPDEALLPFLHAAQKRGSVVEVYRAVPADRAAEAFSYLALPRCQAAGGLEVPGPAGPVEPGTTRLRELVAAHEARCGPDPDRETRFYKAFLLAADGRLAEAEPGLARAVAEFSGYDESYSWREGGIARQVRTNV